MAGVDYSALSSCFSSLGKPAQRALLNSGILTVQDLSRRTRQEVAALHGMGPSSFPKLEAALAEADLRFKPRAEE